MRNISIIKIYRFIESNFLKHVINSSGFSIKILGNSTISGDRNNLKFV